MQTHAKILDLSDRRNMFYWQTNRPITAIQDKQIFLNRHQSLDLLQVKKAVELGMAQAGFSGSDTLISKIQPVIKRGLINNVLPVILKSRQEIVIRMHPKGVKNGYFWVEKVASYLAKDQGVPTYKCIIVDDSQTHVPFDFMIMTKVSGQPMQDLWPIEPKLEEKLIRKTGRIAAMIHKIKTSGFGFFKNDIAKSENRLLGQYRTFSQHIYAALTEDLQFLTDHQVISRDQSKKIEKLFSKHADLLTCPQAVLVHNDIADWNELTDGKKITGIMDWDECFGGDPVMELSAYSLFFGEPRLTWFNQGYEEISKLEDWQEKFQLFKLRYLVSKLHLRKKRSTVDNSEQLRLNLTRGLQAMIEVFAYFKV